MNGSEYQEVFETKLAEDSQARPVVHERGRQLLRDRGWWRFDGPWRACVVD